ncbi:uncharacterized protein LOC143234129 isoform X1 [Tachypleus tridentatus]|uniref:uncharacterized protein LOC143234129 isoform X1 n=1 Tax=Tachypleus tridentatus TaxID=6853 RepID=UPI003FD0AAA9
MSLEKSRPETSFRRSVKVFVTLQINYLLVVSGRRFRWEVMAVFTEHGKRYMCPDCQGTFCSTHSLRNHHLYQHRAERKFQCTHCGKAYTRNADLKAHEKSCSNKD